MRRLRASGYRNLVTRTPRRARPDRPGGGARVLRGGAARRTCSSPRRRWAASSPTTPTRRDFIYENLAIQTNVIHEAWRAGVQRAAVPRLVVHLSARLPAADQGGVSADRAARADQRALRDRQDRRHQDVLVLQPPVRHALPRAPCRRTSTVPGDNYDLQTSHVLPGADPQVPRGQAARATRSVTVWGSGTPRREFLLQRRHGRRLRPPRRTFRRGRARLGAERAPLVNVGCGEDLTIAELAAAVRRGGRLQRRDRVRPHQARRHAAQAARHRARALFGLAAAHPAGGGLAVDLRVFCQPVNDSFSSRRPPWGTWCINARP